MPDQTAADDGAVLVTGGGGGLGAAICWALHRCGYHVLVHYGCDREAAFAVVERIHQDGGVAAAVQADFSEPDAAEKLFVEVDRHASQVHALINNAAWDPGARSLLDTDEAFTDRLLAVNLKAPLLLAREAVRRWGDRGQPGVIVNIGSIQSTHSVAGHSVYAASKGGLDAVTHQLAVELVLHRYKRGQ